MTLKRLIYILLVSLTAIGCDKKEMTPSQVNDWIYRTVAENYLWSATIKSHGMIDNSLSAPNYFEQLRFRVNTGVSPVNEPVSDRFSKLSTNNPQSRSLNPARKSDAGIELRYYVSVTGVLHECHVLFAYKNSPAYAAGVKRGDVFNRINGKAVSSLTISEVQDMLSASTITLDLVRPQQQTVSFNNYTYNVMPIVADSIYNDGVAYLHYASFNAGVNDVSINSMKAFFNRVKTAGVKDLILDMRYNGGGELRVAQMLGSLIVRSGALNDVMIYKEGRGSIGNPQGFEPMWFLSGADAAENCDIQRLVIITSDVTASASELIMHSLKPYYGNNMAVVGLRTRGKNLGGIEYSSDRHNWLLYLMTFRVHDRNRVSGFESGIAPDYELSETDNIVTLSQLGDRTRDVLLSKAFEFLGKGGKSFSATSHINKSSANGDLRMIVDIPAEPLLEERITTNY